MSPDLAVDAELPEACVVYGGGGFGRLLVEELAAVGVVVSAVLDRAVANPLGSPPVLAPSALPNPGAQPVLIGVCNPHASPAEIAASLHELGFDEVWSPPTAFGALGRKGCDREHYWLTTDVGRYDRAADQISYARKQLADERSAVIFERLLRYRTTGDIDALPEVDPPELQYCPADVDFIAGPVALVDAGAYDGDILRTYARAGVDLVSVVAFEPDPVNFGRLTRELDAHPGVVALAFPLGIGRRTEIVRFDADGTTGAAIAEQGEAAIQCVALDDTLRGWRPTHVKMDIEGAEADALAGMSELLATVRPRLAISAYHRPDHLWALLLQLAELDLGYRFHLRCYGEQCFDSVLYALPE